MAPLAMLSVVRNIPLTSRYVLEPQPLMCVSEATTFPMLRLYCCGVMRVNLQSMSANNSIVMLPTFTRTDLLPCAPILQRL